MRERLGVRALRAAFGRRSACCFRLANRDGQEARGDARPPSLGTARAERRALPTWKRRAEALAGQARALPFMKFGNKLAVCSWSLQPESPEALLDKAAE